MGSILAPTNKTVTFADLPTPHPALRMIDARRFTYGIASVAVDQLGSGWFGRRLSIINSMAWPVLREDSSNARYTLRIATSLERPRTLTGLP
jgi:hypothetical protein